MEKLTSILVVLNRNETDGNLVAKAVLLARSVGARICLFSCDADLAYILRHSYDRQDVEKSWRASVAGHLSYLEALRKEAKAPDIDISIAAACESPLYEAVVKKAVAIKVDLVMKNASGAHLPRQFTFDSNDWQLARVCPVTLMLVRGRQWLVPPRFAALVDVSEEETPHLAEAIVRTSEYLALGCRGDVDIVYSEPVDDSRERNKRMTALEGLVREHHVISKHVHVLNGDPEVTLPEFATRQRYDALVLGALTHHEGIAALVGTLTLKLVDAIDCDFILVKRAGPKLRFRDSQLGSETGGGIAEVRRHANQHEVAGPYA